MTYELLASGAGERLEQWGDILVKRPEPQAFWRPRGEVSRWDTPDALFSRSISGEGAWEKRGEFSDAWQVRILNFVFEVKLLSGKQLGLFPEQITNWIWLMDILLKAGPGAKVLNLFSSTGGSTLACAKSGAHVCHVDASRTALTMARRNAELSGLLDAPIRYIPEDAKKFVEREIRRGHFYEGIIMDPPSFGRGPQGETFSAESEVFKLLELSLQLLSQKPLFFLFSIHTPGFSETLLRRFFEDKLRTKFGGTVSLLKLEIEEKGGAGKLPCGIAVRWSNA